MINTFEAHVTVDYIAAKHTNLDVVAKVYKFRLANLLMSNGAQSAKDFMMTSHDENYRVLESRMVALIYDLKTMGFTLMRYKIEMVILDSKAGDTLKLK